MTCLMTSSDGGPSAPSSATAVSPSASAASSGQSATVAAAPTGAVVWGAGGGATGAGWEAGAGCGAAGGGGVSANLSKYALTLGWLALTKAGFQGGASLMPFSVG